MTCPFCRIAEQPDDSESVFLNTSHVLGFFDIQPLVSSQAHVLVIPRKHYETLDKLAADPETSSSLGLWLPRVANELKKEFGDCAFNIVQNNGTSAGQVVPHVHFHIVIRDHSTNVSQTVAKLRKNFSWRERLEYELVTFGKGQREESEKVKTLSKRLEGRLSKM